MSNWLSCCFKPEDADIETQSTHSEINPRIATPPINHGRRIRQKSESSARGQQTTVENPLLHEIICKKKNQLEVGRSFRNQATSSTTTQLEVGRSFRNQATSSTTTQLEVGRSFRNQATSSTTTQSNNLSVGSPFSASTDRKNSEARAREGLTQHECYNARAALPTVAKQRSYSSGNILERRGYINMDSMKRIEMPSPTAIHQFHVELARTCPDTFEDTTSEEEDETDRDLLNEIIRKKRQQLATEDGSARSHTLPLDFMEGNSETTFSQFGFTSDISNQVEYTDMHQARAWVTAVGHLTPELDRQTNEHVPRGYVDMNKMKKVAQPSPASIQQFQEEFAKMCPEAMYSDDEETDSEDGTGIIRRSALASSTLYPYSRRSVGDSSV